MIVVLDASVILKWLFEDPIREPDTEKAIALVESVVSGKLEILQPLHWLAEAAAVAARLVPETAVGDVEMLTAFEFPTSDNPNVVRRATSLAIETNLRKGEVPTTKGDRSLRAIPKSVASLI